MTCIGAELVKYRTNPAVTYLPVSPDEVIARGGHLEGFSLVISDDTGRGLAVGVLDAIADGASAESVHSSIGGDAVATLDEIEIFLDELRRSGAILAADAPRDRYADWNAFVRFGELADPKATMPLTVAGSDAAKALATALADLGLDVATTLITELDDLAPYVVIEQPPSETAQPEDDVSSQPVPERGLIVVSEGMGLSELHALNERAVVVGASVLYTQLAGVEFAVGPYVVPGSTACYWEVERQRARTAFSYSEYMVLTSAPGRRGTVPPVAQRTFVATALPHAVELALLGHSSLAGSVLRGRATTGETSRHRVMRLPRCPVCLPNRPLLRNLLYG